MPRSALRKALANLGLVVVSSVVGLLLCEAVLRTFVRVGSFAWHGETGQKWNQEDPERGYVLTPGYRGRLVAPEFSNPVRINSLGFRGPEPSPTDRPIVVIGDSFTFGVGADEHETIPAQLQAALSADGAPRPVWNLGVPSYSSPQYRATLDRVVEHTTPSAVIVCLFIGRLPSDANDLWGAVTFERSRAEPTPELSPTVTPSPGRPSISLASRARRGYKWLQRHSAVFVFAAARVAPTLRARRQQGRTLIEEEQRQFDEGWQLLHRDLTAMAATTTRLGASLWVVHIPEASDVVNGAWSTSERLTVLTEELGLPLVDFQGSWDAAAGRELYFPLDGHLNPRGYARVGQAIAVALRDHPTGGEAGPSASNLPQAAQERQQTTVLAARPGG